MMSGCIFCGRAGSASAVEQHLLTYLSDMTQGLNVQYHPTEIIAAWALSSISELQSYINVGPDEAEVLKVFSGQVIKNLLGDDEKRSWNQREFRLYDYEWWAHQIEKALRIYCSNRNLADLQTHVEGVVAEAMRVSIKVKAIQKSDDDANHETSVRRGRLLRQPSRAQIGMSDQRSVGTLEPVVLDSSGNFRNDDNDHGGGTGNYNGGEDGDETSRAQIATPDQPSVATPNPMFRGSGGSFQGLRNDNMTTGSPSLRTRKSQSEIRPRGSPSKKLNELTPNPRGKSVRAYVRPSKVMSQDAINKMEIQQLGLMRAGRETNSAILRSNGSMATHPQRDDTLRPLVLLTVRVLDKSLVTVPVGSSTTLKEAIEMAWELGPPQTKNRILQCSLEGDGFHGQEGVWTESRWAKAIIAVDKGLHLALKLVLDA